MESTPTLLFLKLIVVLVLNPTNGDPLDLLSLQVGPKPKLIAWFSTVLVVLGLGQSKNEG